MKNFSPSQIEPENLILQINNNIEEIANQSMNFGDNHDSAKEEMMNECKIKFFENIQKQVSDMQNALDTYVIGYKERHPNRTVNPQVISIRYQNKWLTLDLITYAEFVKLIQDTLNMIKRNQNSLIKKLKGPYINYKRNNSFSFGLKTDAFQNNEEDEIKIEKDRMLNQIWQTMKRMLTRSSNHRLNVMIKKCLKENGNLKLVFIGDKRTRYKIKKFFWAVLNILQNTYDKYQRNTLTGRLSYEAKKAIQDELPVDWIHNLMPNFSQGEKK